MRIGLLVAMLMSLTAMSAAADATAPVDAIEAGATARSTATRLTPPPRSLSVIAGGDVLTEERVRFAAAKAITFEGRIF